MMLIMAKFGRRVQRVANQPSQNKPPQSFWKNLCLSLFMVAELMLMGFCAIAIDCGTKYGPYHMMPSPAPYIHFTLAVFHVLIANHYAFEVKMQNLEVMEMQLKQQNTEVLSCGSKRSLGSARNTRPFTRRHLGFWSESAISGWAFCEFSLAKSQMTLRHGFIMAHLAPQSSAKFDFQKYIKRSLEEDFKVVVGISPALWLLAVFFLLFNIDGWYSYLWLPFIPIQVILLVGTKLQVIITKMAMQIVGDGDVIKGDPVVQPTDELFWFKHPHLLLHLIHFVLFQNAFQLAFFTWTWYEFGYPSCFHRQFEDILIRISLG
ncbi:MLO-like protein 6 [Dioscorea cayenensis subsp. rotundata]|uniref:MLO-like protein 6 n=1 Tax=Dioscorea cayennensis subsp. rotundata TaxID=55577 RepID=A0AB40C3M4_DIOCR|nr:MLO-like protein 6 [Dioscorea cayenensis subsp. rotundata]